MAELPRRFNGRRFESGIGSLDAYDQTITPIVELLRNAPVQQQPVQQQPVSVQQPTPAETLMLSAPTLEEEFKQRQETYRGILGDPEQQRNMTQAQMLFDIANTALAFSTAGSRPGMSPAERLAEAAVETKLFPTISARAAAQQEQQQKFDLAALQSAETSVAAKEKAVADYREALLKKKPNTVTVDGQVVDISDTSNPKVVFGTKDRKTTTIDGQLIDYTDPENPRVVFGTKKPSTVTLDGQIIDVSDKNNPVVLFGTQDRKTTTIDGQLIDFTDPDNPRVVFGTKEADTVTLDGQIIDVSDVDNPKVLFGEKDRDLRTIKGQIIDVTDVTTPKVVFGDRERELRTVAGQVIDFTNSENPEVLFGEKDRDYRIVDGQVVDVTDPSATFVVFGEKKRDIKTDARGRLVDFTNPENPQVVWDVTATHTPKLQAITINGQRNVVDIKSPEGQLALKQMNEAEAEVPGSTSIENITSARPAKMFVIKNSEGRSVAVTSYNGGRTYSKNGLPVQMPEGAIPVSDTVGYEINKQIAVANRAGDELAELDKQLVERLKKDGDVSTADIMNTQDGLEKARLGTGLWASAAMVGNAAIGIIPDWMRPEFLNRMTDETAAARQYLKLVETLGRPALIVNPRMPVAELERVRDLFPQIGNIFADPVTESRKLVELRSAATAQLQRQLRILAEDKPAKKQVEQIQASNFELRRLISLLPNVPLAGEDAGVSDADIDEAAGYIN